MNQKNRHGKNRQRGHSDAHSANNSESDSTMHTTLESELRSYLKAELNAKEVPSSNARLVSDSVAAEGIGDQRRGPWMGLGAVAASVALAAGGVYAYTHLSDQQTVRSDEAALATSTSESPSSPPPKPTIPEPSGQRVDEVVAATDDRTHTGLVRAGDGYARIVPRDDSHILQRSKDGVRWETDGESVVGLPAGGYVHQIVRRSSSYVGIVSTGSGDGVELTFVTSTDLETWDSIAIEVPTDIEGSPQQIPVLATLGDQVTVAFDMVVPHPAPPESSYEEVADGVDVSRTRRATLHKATSVVAATLTGDDEVVSHVVPDDVLVNVSTVGDRFVLQTRSNRDFANAAVASADGVTWDAIPLPEQGLAEKMAGGDGFLLLAGDRWEKGEPEATAIDVRIRLLVSVDEGQNWKEPTIELPKSLDGEFFIVSDVASFDGTAMVLINRQDPMSDSESGKLLLLSSQDGTNWQITEVTADFADQEGQASSVPVGDWQILAGDADEAIIGHGVFQLTESGNVSRGGSSAQIYVPLESQ